jgi:Zn-dependent protease with chaperone function
MRRTLPLAFAALLPIAGALSACAYNPELGRDQMSIVDDSSLNRAGEQGLEPGPGQEAMVSNDRRQRPGARRRPARGRRRRPGAAPWDYAVFEDAAPNAFVLPGGHVGVTTGLLNLVDNDDQLAAVIGHEAGHVVARHAAERQSQNMTSSLVLGVLGAYAGSSTRGGRSPAMGAARPSTASCCRSRASRNWRPTAWASTSCSGPAIARARRWSCGSTCRPRAAPTPQFASTHPSDATRIAALQAYIAQRGW